VLTSGWTSTPGLHLWTLPPPGLVGGTAGGAQRAAHNSPVAAQISLQAGRPLPGGMWLPADGFDRGDATAFGAPEARRALQRARGLQGKLLWRGARNSVVVHSELLQHTHRYITLPVDEPASRATLLGVGQLGTASPTRLTFGLQMRRRAAEGAEFRWPQDHTADSAAYAALGQLHRTLQHDRLQLWLGVGWRQQRSRPQATSPLSDDLLDSWLMLQQPRFFADRHSGRLDARVDWQLLGPWHLDSRLGLSGQQENWHIPGDSRRISLDHQPWRRIEYAAARQSQLWQAHLRSEIGWRPRYRQLALDGFMGIDASTMAYGPRADDALSLVSPAGGLSARYKFGPYGGEVFAQARQEPWNLDATVGNFLAAGTPAGEVVGDTPTTDGQIVGRTGSPIHGVHPSLGRPSTQLWSIGYSTTPLGPVRLRVQGVGRHLRRRFVVAASPESAGKPVQLPDPGGDGRGEQRAPGGGQLLTAYAQSPQDLATQGFALTNAAAYAHYLGFEFALDTPPFRRASLHLSGAAYLSSGSAPFGNGVDRNDSGALDESSAGPNNALHATGRYAGDRAYLLKLLAAARPWQNLHLGLSIRFRDGEPFTRLLLANTEALPQGPTLLMGVDRGEPRYTFDATCDLRVRYTLPSRPFGGSIGVDVFNLLGFATEIMEDPRTGPSFRRALEAIPRRSLMVNLELDVG
jgi:hypothetical protein